MKIDYIIVGFGLAGLAYAEELEKHNKSFIVISDNSQNSSKVAAGMFNPVVLKRFTPVWNGKDQLKLAIPFYEKIEEKLNQSLGITEKKIIKYVDIYAILKTVEQQNNWFSACDKPVMEDYMLPKIFKNTNEYIIAPLGFGKLTNTGQVRTNLLLDRYKKYLLKNNKFIAETFQHKDLIIKDTTVDYHNITATKIVFCEGFGIKTNPFFNYLPLNEAKGELLIIKAPKLQIDFMIKAAIFILPLGNDLYKIGATFNWKDKTSIPTKEGKEELIKKLETVIDVDYTIINQLAGIRPTVKDRRPLIGKHPKYKNVSILNGLGTRGVMLAPTMAKLLYQNLEENIDLDKVIDIKRYENLIKYNSSVT